MTWTEAQMAAYRATAQQREQQRRDRLRQRCDLGQSVARQASDLLKQEFGAERVVLFGSMRSPDLVHERSDVDLAVGAALKGLLSGSGATVGHPSRYARGLGRSRNGLRASATGY